MVLESSYEQLSSEGGRRTSFICYGFYFVFLHLIGDRILRIISQRWGEDNVSMAAQASKIGARKRAGGMPKVTRMSRFGARKTIGGSAGIAEVSPKHAEKGQNHS